MAGKTIVLFQHSRQPIGKHPDGDNRKRYPGHGQHAETQINEQLTEIIGIPGETEKSVGDKPRCRGQACVLLHIGPEMEKEGYAKEFGAAVNITSATVGLVIPPSNVLIVYSLASGGVSIAALFLAGYILCSLSFLLSGIFTTQT